ncbi:trypsin-like peptidase domain-containing protein [Streptomyces sp. NPDC058735]|uniref:nSTAND1 domain-containing NTPase n=1 Tax=Streptomyces sp. NPDC058735 TaxID=3346616 RepID=UPI0036C6F5AB
MTTAEARSPSASPAFEQGLARLWDADGLPLGAGFLITSDLVCTCAHVLAGEVRAPSAVPDTPVRVDFPLLADGSGPPVTATVAEWRPDDDVALLRLEHPVHGAAPLPLASPDQALWGREARVYGFPEDTVSGVNAHGVLRGGQGAGRIQLDTGAGSVPVLPGFSGSPVWDVGARTVVGMIAARGGRSLTGTAYLIPARRLAPVRTPAAEGREPFKGLLRFEEEDAPLFHGREDDAAALAEAVRERPLVLVTGQSGTGKSSVLRAGLLPRLREADAVVVVRTPREADDPAVFLGEALLALWDAAGPDAPDDARGTVVREGLTGDGLALGRLRERLRSAAGDRLCVLAVDQFEEYAAAAPRAARRVVAWLRELTGVADLVPGRGLRAVLTARNATLDTLAPALPAARLTRALVRLDPLADDALARVISEPLRSVPGAGLEPGLAELLLRDAREAQDAHGEADALPLLEFTLARLWQRRTGGTLTHAAYQDLGGLSGALARHAQDTLDAALAEGLADQETARRLFQRLARPYGLGRFLPDTVPAAELDEGQMRLARRMAKAKLLAWTRPRPGGPPGESLRMAHEALLREWEWLRTCLREGEEFRAWQAEVAERARVWQEAGGRPFAVVPVELLGAAGRWQSERARDITQVQRAYLAAGRRHARRGAYVLRAFAATVTVFTILAGWLAWDASRSRDAAQQQLRVSAAGQLADLSEERSSADLALSVQAAMGAWATSRTDEARGALFRQYLRMRDVERMHVGLWPGSVRDVTSAPGTDVLAVVTSPDEESKRRVSVIMGAASGRPRALRLRNIPDGDFSGTFSDDGRWYAAGGADGSVRLWPVGEPDAEPRLLAGARDGLDESYGSPLDFSDDGSRLLRLHAYDVRPGKATDQRAALEVWDVASGAEVPVPGRLAGGRDADTACFTDGRDEVALTWTQERAAETAPLMSAAVFGLAEGRERRRLVSDTEIARCAARGQLVEVAGLRGAPSRLLDTSGTQRERRLPYDFVDHDASGLYSTRVRMDSPLGGSPEYGLLTLVGATDGRTWTTVTPTDGDTDESQVAVWPPEGGGGRPRVVALVGDALLRLRPAEGADVVTLAPDRSGEDRPTPAPDGRRFAVRREERVFVGGPGRPYRSAALPGSAHGPDPWQVTWVDAGGEDVVVAWDPGGARLVLYDVDDPARHREVRLKAGEGTRIESVARLGNGELAVLLSSNEVLRLDPRTGGSVAPALRVAPRPTSTPPFLSSPGQLIPRPGHPTQALIVTVLGHRTGQLLLWDLVAGTRVSAWYTSTGVAGQGSDRTEQPLVFSADGRLLAVTHGDEKVRFWDVAQGGRRVGRTVPASGGGHLLALLGHHTLVTAGDGFTLYDVPTGRVLGNGQATVGGDRFATVWSGTEAHLVADGQVQSFRVDPEAWWRALCAGANRPYRPEEREVLPPGAHTGPPCSAS